MTKVVILQSNYIPWKGYFDLINDSDYFIFYDEVQYTKNDWRNRNIINTKQGQLWLTVPVGTNIRRRICDVNIGSSKWQSKHLSTLQMSYSKFPYFQTYIDLLNRIYSRHIWTSLSELNQAFVQEVSALLGVNTKFLDSRQIPSTQESTLGRLIELIKSVGGTQYITGPSAQSYLVEEKFTDQGINVFWKNYDGYPEYQNKTGNDFSHYVSILDLLFSVGPDSPQFIWGWRQ